MRFTPALKRRRHVALQLCVLLAVSMQPLNGQLSLQQIYIDQRVPEEAADVGFLESLWIALHSPTRFEQIDNEILFHDRNAVDEQYLRETELALLRTGMFQSAVVDVDTVRRDEADVYVIVRDKYSVMPFVDAQTGGEITRFGGGINQRNIAGSGIQLGLQAIERSELDIGVQGDITVRAQRLFGSRFELAGGVRANKVRTTQRLRFERMATGFNSLMAYGIEAEQDYGTEFLFTPFEIPLRNRFRERRLSGWFSTGVHKGDRLYVTALVSVEKADRSNEFTRQALDNSARVMLEFSSLSREYDNVPALDGGATAHEAVGAWGSAVLGRMFPIGSRGEHLFYAGGQIQQSVVIGDKAYLFGRVTAGSGFQNSNARYTYQEFLGVGHYRAASDLIIAARIRQQTAWNWEAYRQLILDNDAGLRGYLANDLAGDSRIIVNTEARYTPLPHLGSFALEAAAFVDLGVVWNAGLQLGDARVRKAVGAGLRLHTTFWGERGLIRLDMPYNFDEGKVTQIALSTRQSFSLTGRHTYSLPRVYGETIDTE